MKSPLAQALRSRIAAQKLRQSEAAEKLGIKESTLSQWLTGKQTPRLHYKTARGKLAKFLRITEDDVIQLVAQSKPNENVAPIPEKTGWEVAGRCGCGAACIHGRHYRSGAPDGAQCSASGEAFRTRHSGESGGAGRLFCRSSPTRYGARELESAGSTGTRHHARDCPVVRRKLATLTP